MIIKGSYKNARISSRKLFLYSAILKNMFVEDAFNLLSFSKKKASKIIFKLLKSVVSYSEHNYNANIEKLKVKTFYVCQAKSYKRNDFFAKGRSAIRKKRNSHIFLELKEG